VNSAGRIAEQAERKPVDGDFEALESSSEAVTTFYFDGPPFHEWTAFTGDGLRLVMDGKWLSPRL
jgi:hypothetical protein